MKSRAISTFIAGKIEGVVIRPLQKHRDERGSLAELFRNDELDEAFQPTMAYLSFTKPGLTRGPHEHMEQSDLFCFGGPSDFAIRMWDNRPSSPTYRNMMDLTAGDKVPTMVVVPAGVVHAYRNIGEVDGMVVNCPNRLYMGNKRSEPIDEIRHEDDPDTEFLMD